MMNDDMDLVRAYAAHQSEQAFATLVERHVNLVHSAAARQAGDPHLAGEITQTVFVILARKAGGLSPNTILSGWLYRTTRFVASAALRKESRRQRREQEAYMQALANPDQSETCWEEWSPLLDEAMAQLRDKDRDAIVLRYFENRTLKEVGGALGVEERTAQKRVLRGLEKLRRCLAKRGVVLAAAAIAGAVSANSVHAAPVTLAQTVTTMALAKGAAASGSTFALIKGTLKLMAWTKAKMAIIVTAGIILATGSSIVAVEKSRLVQGKTEDEWIKSIVYNGDENQTKRWHALGPRGVQMLIHALKSKPTGQSDKQRNDDRVMHMCAADLLCVLEDLYGDQNVNQELISALKTEKDASVRGLELGCFEMPIKTLPEKEKIELLPELLRGLHSRDASERYNALVSLQYYPDQSATVVPLIVHALQDPDRSTRLMAIEALGKIDLETAIHSGIVQILAGYVTDPYEDVFGVKMMDVNNAGRAIVDLGNLHRDPGVAIPALLQALQSSDSYIRASAATALGKFAGEARTAMPALQKALEDPDSPVRRQAGAALKLIDS